MTNLDKIKKEFEKKWIKRWCYSDPDGKDMPNEVWSFVEHAYTQGRKEGYIEGFSKGMTEMYLDREKRLPKSYQKGFEEGRKEIKQKINENV